MSVLNKITSNINIFMAQVSLKTHIRSSSFVQFSLPSLFQLVVGSSPVFRVADFKSSLNKQMTSETKGVKTGFGKSDMLSRLYALQSLEVDGECG